MSKMPILIGPELQCLSSLLLSPAGFRHKQILGGPILYGLFGSLEHARLTAIKSAFRFDLPLVYSTPQSKIFWTTEVKPPTLVLENPVFNIFSGCIEKPSILHD